MASFVPHVNVYPAKAEDRRLFIEAAKLGDGNTVNRLLSTTNIDVDSKDEVSDIQLLRQYHLRTQFGLTAANWSEEENQRDVSLYLAAHGAHLHEKELVRLI